MDSLDLLEECQPLHLNECSLLDVAATTLQEVLRAKLIYWRQHFNLKLAFEWDENSRFFHASASGWKRKNHIQELQDGDSLCTSHTSKAVILHNFYSNLLGLATPTQWDFSLSDLYPTYVMDEHTLTEPFSLDEATKALFAMDSNSSPIPDGFGPAFYRLFWSRTKLNILAFLNSFHGGSADVDSLNRAHLVLLPKKV
ncbi:uncharacterized protein [Miscanthus floridulus]|uniref:uncharacterized protein n=1 Tax=Miscanthus floridulus TaxID=154761 RepID=UPI003459A12E